MMFSCTLNAIMRTSGSWRIASHPSGGRVAVVGAMMWRTKDDPFFYRHSVTSQGAYDIQFKATTVTTSARKTKCTATKNKEGKSRRVIKMSTTPLLASLALAVEP